MNWLDAVLALIIGVSLFTGFRKGLLRIGIGFAAVFVGFLAASWFYGTVAAFLLPYVTSKPAANVLGFLLVFVSILALGTLLSVILTRFFKMAGINWLDRLLGGVFGLVRGLLISVVLVMMLSAFSFNAKPQAVIDSTLAPYVLESARILSAMTPNEIKLGFRRSYENIKKSWNGALKKGPLKKTEIQ
ncbi:MAG TPA: CvpA family protein [Bryobacteraceae bacterium]|nr:CvpA family protein [Bryobacteraceae bacterium]